MKKILFVIPAMGCGGAERVTIIFAKQFIKLGYDVKLIVLTNDEGELREFVPSDMQVIYLSASRSLFSVFGLARLIRKEKPDFVFSSLDHSSVPLMVATLFNKKTKVIIRHSYSIKYFPAGKIKNLLLRYTYSVSDLIVAQTVDMRSELIEYFKIRDLNKIHVIINPVDVDIIEEKSKETSPFLSHTVNYVAVGSVCKRKGFDLLVKSFGAVVKGDSSSHLYIIGKVSDPPLVADAMKLPYANHLHFVGFSDNPYKYIANCDCFVLSSRADGEGLPNVMLEAMYLKKPIVATRCIPFVERAIKNGINGLVVDVDNVNELSEALCKILMIKTSLNYNLKTDSLFNLVEKL